MKKKYLQAAAFLCVMGIFLVGCTNKQSTLTDEQLSPATITQSQAPKASPAPEAASTSANVSGDTNKTKVMADRAKEYVQLVINNEIDKAYALVPENLHAAFSKDQLQQGADQIQAMYGAIEETRPVDESKIEIIETGNIVFVDCEYKNLIVTYAVGLDKDNGVMMMYAAKTQVKNARVMPETLVEEAISVDAETGYPLDGLLTMPKNAAEKIPAVVLVHGSGPHDKNETIGVNTVFDQLAYGLAEKGIAVVRYDKRTFAHGEKIAKDPTTLTVEEETIQDAIAAVNVLKEDSRIDGDKIYIVGHSQGGMLAPRIVAEGEGIAGIVSLAGSPRSLFDIVKQQILGRVELTEDSKAIKNAIQADDELMKKLKDMSDEEAKKTLFLTLNINGYYMKDFDRDNPSDLIKENKIPVLFLQGDKDNQVFEKEDFNLWKEELKDYDNASYKLYPNLNHLFIPYTEGDFLAMYPTIGDIPSEVFDDIANWIFAQTK